jgi:hypothetical protein
MLAAMVLRQPCREKSGYRPPLRFRPRLLPTLAALVLVPLFIAFGQWQWNKA